MAKQRSESVFSMGDSNSRSDLTKGGEARAASERLAYVVALSDGADGDRVLARAASVLLARAIFAAACTEYPGRRIVLKQGQAILQDTASGA